MISATLLLLVRGSDLLSSSSGSSPSWAGTNKTGRNFFLGWENGLESAVARVRILSFPGKPFGVARYWDVKNDRAERVVAADRGRHPGFPRFDLLAGGPGG